jgi:hypothetical protein
MSDERMSELLDLAVPPVPEHLRAAPLTAIHRRARRRRTVTAMVATGAAVLVLVVAMVLSLPGPRRTSLPMAPASSSPSLSLSPVAGAVAWQLARVDRAERTVTVFVNPGGGRCTTLVQGSASVSELPDKVVVAARGDIAQAADCARSSFAVPLLVTLSTPLAGRPVVDAATGRPPPAYHDRELPTIPADWSEVPADYGGLSGDWFALSYTRGGGPDLAFRIYRTGAPSMVGGERITLGRRTGTLFKESDTWKVRWRSGNYDYVLSLVPSEGVTVTRAEALAAVRRLGWDT